mgnify:FL=1
MKPIKLVISAIGPYADIIPEIDFTRFEDKGLFLITGDTGAGKTTIFDAICYALYGQTSGQYRKTGDLRSEYAGDDVPSFVEFTFSHQGKMYRVRREPEYNRSKKRGAGIITEPEKASFQKEMNTPIEGVKQVNSAVKELLHIDYDQFKQIAMIAQGEFQQLLNAGTDDRTKILRTLFKTEGYKDIESRLNTRLSQNKEDKERIEQSIIQHFNDIKCDESDELHDEFTDLHNQINAGNTILDINYLIEVTNKIIDSDELNCEKYKQQLKESKDELDKLNEKYNRANDNNKLINRCEQLKIEKQELDDRKKEIDNIVIELNKQKNATRNIKPQYDTCNNGEVQLKNINDKIAKGKSDLLAAEEYLEKAKNDLESQESKQVIAEELKRKVDKLDGEETKYQLKEQKLSELSKYETEIKDFTKKKDDLDKQEIDLDNHIQELKVVIADLEGSKDDLSKFKVLNDRFLELNKSICDIIQDQLPKRIRYKEELSKNQGLYKELSQEYDSAVEKYTLAERLMDRCRAGLLAEKLTEGIKCPVCGSTHHPELAILPDDSVTEEELNDLKNTMEKARNKKDEATSKAESSNATLKTLEGYLKESIIKILNNELIAYNTDNKSLDDLTDDLHRAKELVERNMKENENIIRKLSSDNIRLEKAKIDLNKAQDDEKNTIAQHKQDLLSTKNDIEAKIKSNKDVVESIGELSFPDWKSAQNERDLAKKEIKEILENIKKAQENKQTAEKNVTKYKSSLDTLNGEYVRNNETYEQEKEKLINLIKKYEFGSIEEAIPYIVTEKQINESEQYINEYNNNVAANEAQLKQAVEDTEGKHLIDIQAIAEKLKRQNDEVEDLRRVLNTTDNRLRINKDKCSIISKKKSQYEKTSKEKDICNKLYSLVRGGAGNYKITLEQYVQIAGFDGIIAAANRRLVPMSDGQFELYRKTDDFGKQKNMALALEVKDNNTGHTRPVGSLSGGESFKASLSLALGLSDTVSTNKGGIQMDALFVDEGFGTLDRKSMDSAMDVLVKLSGSNKLVGIISHREELMENIPQQIKVSKSKSGSTISIETGV